MIKWEGTEIFGNYFFRMKVFGVKSIKDKRSVSRSIIAKLQNKFKAAAAEIEDQQYENSLGLGVALVSSDYIYLEKSYQSIMEYIESNYPVEIYESDYHIE